MERIATGLLVLLLSSTAQAELSKAQQERWARICQDRDRARLEAECWQPPGDYQKVYQMRGDKRRYAKAQGQRAVEIRKSELHDRRTKR